jgi:hypothetical protein
MDILLNDNHYDHTLNDAEIVELGISQQIVKDDIYMPHTSSIHKNNSIEPFKRGYVLIDNEKGNSIDNMMYFNI